MKLIASALLVIASLLPAVAGAADDLPGVGDFALLDHQGKFHQLSWYGDNKAIVIFVQGNGCPIVRNGAPTLRAIRDEYEGKGVAFFMLNPQPQDNRESIAAEASEFGFDLPILVDEAQLVAESLGVDRTAETFIIDPKKMQVVFRGPIDDRLGYETQKPEAKNHYLRDALDAVLAGGSPAKVDVSAPGCLISFPARERHLKNPVSYTDDIAPMLIDKCTDCHHDGGIGPWSMTNHAMVQGWSRMMKEVVMTRRMPPGQIDPHVGKPIRGVAEMTPADLQALVHWIDAGATMEDGAADPLANLQFEDPKWSLGEPDIVLEVPPQSIPATGVIDYRYIPVNMNLDRDIWIRAVEFRPGDPKVLHHVIAYLSSPADEKARSGAVDTDRDESIAGFAPGRQTDNYGDSTGRLIRKGSNLLLQMHYTTSGKETVDATEIGIYLHDKPPTYVMSGGVAGQRRFLIPAGAREYKLEGAMDIERDAYLYSMSPHMHYRGKYMSYYAEYPDGRSELLLSVPRYDFNWQFRYSLAEPVFLPAGSRIVARGAMDNSDRNPYNPDPEKPVVFGLQTRHEMFFGFLTLRYVGDTPEAVSGGASAGDDGVAGL